MVTYKPTKETRQKPNVNGITLIPLLNSVLIAKNGFVWLTESATNETLVQRKHKVINSKI